MNALKELEKLNNLSFKLLILLPLICIFGNFGLYLTGFEFSQIYIFNIILVVLQVILFVQDRKFLKAKLAYCPAWEWFVLFPVYIYLKDKKTIF